MTQAMTSIAILAAALIGRTVTAAGKDGAPATSYTIAKLSDKLGTMKNGEKAEYVVLQSSADAAVVMTLHPEAAKRLMTKGADAGLVLENVTTDTASTETVVEPAAPVAKVKKAKAPKAAKVKAEKPAKVAKVKKVKAEKAAPADKAPSKKDQFMAVYTPNAAAGKTRQEIKTAAESLGLSLAGFNTYYQNAKSGKWA